MDQFQLIHALTKAQDLIEAAFLQEVMEQGFDHTHVFGWSTQARDLDCLQNFIASESRTGTERAVARIESCIVSLELASDGSLRGRIAGEYDDVHSGLARIRRLLPESLPGHRSLTYSFWRWNSFGGRETKRKILVPSWSEIEDNYPGDTRKSLKDLSKLSDPGDEGHLILWFGPPGVGKSYALRALSWAWRSWANFSYILDPDRFLADAGYMFNVLLESDSRKWTVLVVEDAGDLLTFGNGAREGLPALLNVTDGAVGQGMRVKFLFTTNLKISQIHPALTRSGRCSHTVEFHPFYSNAARDWLRARGNEREVTGRAALSDLYGVLRGKPLPTHARLGF